MATWLNCPQGHPISPTDTCCPVCGTMVVTQADSSPPPSTPQLPTIVGYDLLQELGRGGMGVVYKALQQDLQRVVALKMVLAGKFADPRQSKRFIDEAKALAHFQHPHIVQIFAVGECQGQPFFTLEFVPGGNLARKIAGTPQPAREAATLVETLARAVAAAHQQGIIHRDLKPANILLAADGTPKISDFGLAKKLGEDASRTDTGAILGTPCYMAPEQASGKSKVNPQGQAVDIYALGVILYELLTGRPPFLGESATDTLQQVLDAEPVPPRRLQARVPCDLETICLKCLEKQSAQRYASALALAEDLGNFLNQRPISISPPGLGRRAGKWCRRHPLQVVVLAASLLVLAGLGLWLVEIFHRLALQQRELEKLQREDAQDFAILRAQLADGQYASGWVTMKRANQRLGDEPRLADRQPSWDRLRSLLYFWTHAEDAWFRAGEERYLEGQQAGAAALRHLGILNEQGQFTPQWWTALPTKDLPQRQAQQVEQEAYRLLLLLTYLRTAPWLNPQDWRSPAALAGYRSALAALAQAQAHEDSGRLPPSQTVALFGKILGDLVGQKSAPLAQVEKQAGGGSDARKAIDHFFVGSIHYFVAGADPKSLLPLLIRQSLGQHLRGQDPLALLGTTEERMREAVRLDPKMFWPQFILGRALLNLGKNGEAELAFNTCVALRPDYPVSYQFRALAICRAVGKLAPQETLRREQVLQRAREDSAQALQLSRQTGNPAIYWARADMFAALDDMSAALEAFATGLEQGFQLEKMVFRSNVLDQVERFAGTVLKSDDRNADAHVALALVYLTRRQPEQARQALSRALELAPKHPRALRLLKNLQAL